MRKNDVTPQKVFSRRDFIKLACMYFGGALIAIACANRNLGDEINYASLTDELGSPVTPLSQIQSFGNFYEFTRSHYEIKNLAKNLQTSPWEIEVTGLVKNPKTYTLEDLKTFGEDEYIYRFRCLEAWSLVIPWRGFQLKKLLEEVQPTADAKFVRFVSLNDPEQFPGQDSSQYAEWIQSGARGADAFRGNMGEFKDSPFVWPYAEALRIDEAMHDLTLIATGLYGQSLAPENGSPVRVVVPWKYSYKSIKTIVKIELTAEQPPTFWNQAIPEEFGFYGNVNPDVPHPRWGQARELSLTGDNEGEVIATLPFNGYTSQVAHLYKDMNLKINY